MAFLLRLLGITEQPTPAQLARERPADQAEAFIVVAEAFSQPDGGRDRVVLTFDDGAVVIERQRTRKATWNGRRRLEAAEAAELRAAIEAWQPWGRPQSRSAKTAFSASSCSPEKAPSMRCAVAARPPNSWGHGWSN